MPYIGRAPSKSGAFRILDDISSGFNGSTVAFTLQVSSSNIYVVRDATLMIAVDGVMQEPGSAFTVSGSTITFGSAPLAGASFWGVELGDVGGISSMADAITATAITNATDLGAAPATGDSVLVHDSSAGAVKEMTVANLFTAPAITGNATAVTQTSGNDSTRIATTAFVQAAITGDFQIAVTQSSHGLAVGEAVKVTGNDTYAKAQADSAANSEVVGVVTSVSGNDFTITLNGEIATGGAISAANVAAGTVLFLSQTTAGLLTATEPSTAGQVSKPVALVTSQNARMVLLHYRGEIISTGVQTNAPNDATYVTLSTNGSLTSERTLAAGSGITLTDAGANGAATISIANDAIDSQHYAAGSIDLEHMSSQSVDEDNLHISNAGNNGEFLSKQSGNAGGLTWAAVSSGPSQATKAAMEAETNEDTYVPPDLVKDSPGVAKAWGEASADGATLLANYNVGSLTDNGNGDVEFNYTTAFSSANYGAATYVMGDNDAVYNSWGYQKTASKLRLFAGKEGSITSDHQQGFAAFGDQ